MLTQPPPAADSAAEDKEMGSIWPGLTAFKKKKEWIREENLDDGAKKRAARKWDRSQNSVDVGAKPVSETKQLQYLCLNSTAMTRYVRPFCDFEAFWGLARIQLGEFGFVLNRFETLVHQKQSCVVHIWTIWKSLIPEQDRKQGFPLPKTERTQALATFPVGAECLLCPIQVCKTAVISIVL